MAYTKDELAAIWEKGTPVENFNPQYFRKDVCGAWMIFAQYGNCKSRFGWEINHIDNNPDDSIHNLRPTQWENCQAYDSENPKCIVTGSGSLNVYVSKAVGRDK